MQLLKLTLTMYQKPIEHKRSIWYYFFEQGRNELNIDDDFFSNVVTENKDIPESAKIDMAISMITLKYTQSNSVCFVKRMDTGNRCRCRSAVKNSLCKTCRTEKLITGFFVRQSQVFNLPFRKI